MLPYYCCSFYLSSACCFCCFWVTEKRAWKLEMGYGNGNVNKYVQLHSSSGFLSSFLCKCQLGNCRKKKGKGLNKVKDHKRGCNDHSQKTGIFYLLIAEYQVIAFKCLARKLWLMGKIVIIVWNLPSSMDFIISCRFE